MSGGPFASDQERLAWEGSPIPGWIESPGGPIFAWYHPPRVPVRSRAVLLCDALISDRMNLHLTYRHLALRLSASGYPAMRVDYPGTGDSSGSPRDPRWSDRWQEGLSAALETLLACSGVSRAAVFGARFGGTLAMELAASRSEVDAVALWGPFLSGREFLRSARAMHKLMGSNPSGRRPTNAQSGDEEFSGYLLNRATRDHIESCRPLEMQGAPCAQAKLIAWDAHSKEDQLAARLRDLGVAVDFERIADLRSDDSIASQALPEKVFERLIDWLDEHTPTLGQDPPAAAREGLLERCARVRQSDAIPEEVEERVISFGADGGLFGIESRPFGGVDSSAGTRLLLVNGGNNHRAGINRNYTEWAREAARRGIVTLRFDIRGLGDSPPLRWEDLNQLYRDETREDVLAALEAVSTGASGERLVLAGVCAGAYQALHASLVSDRVDMLVLLDILKWDPDAPNTLPGGFLDRRLHQLSRGRDRLLARLGVAQRFGRRSLASWLEELTRRGVEVVAVGCRGGGGYDRFVEAIESTRPALEQSGRFWLYGLDDADHIFSPIWAQQHLSQILMERLGALPDTAATREVSRDPAP